MSGPSIATIKRLFAVSGNCCAFPRCSTSLVHHDKVTGRICHIKGARPGSARYDASQSDAERHGFSNLILMCPIHHDVIDADETAYTVERLVLLKREREFNQTPLHLDDHAAQQFLSYVNLPNNSGPVNIINQNVSSMNQQGGITAHTVNVPTMKRVMGDGMKQTIMRDCPRDKMIAVWSVAGAEETHQFAEQIFAFMKANGFNLFGNGPTGNMYLGGIPKGVRFEFGDPCNNVIVGYPDGSEVPNP